jgi:hypothetical protein
MKNVSGMSNDVFIVGTEDNWAKVVYRFFDNDIVDHDIEGFSTNHLASKGLTTALLT